MSLFNFLPKPPKPPRPPRLSRLLTDHNPLRDIVEDGRSAISDAMGEVRELAGAIRLEPLTTERKTVPPVTAVPPSTSSRSTPAQEVESLLPGVSDADTLKYQLGLILDDLNGLETEHLPAKGRIFGRPCDCIAKHSRTLHRHAVETTPIAARQSKDTKIYYDLTVLAQHLMEIGTKDAVTSGKYDDEYLRLSGVVSNFRKRVESLMSSCSSCKTVNDLKAFVENR